MSVLMRSIQLVGKLYRNVIIQPVSIENNLFSLILYKIMKY